jgi:thioesterase domain-containing protein
VQRVAIARTIRDMPLRPLRTGDDQLASLCCVHPVTGSAEDYAGLAGAIAWAGPIVGLDAPATIGTLTEVASGHCDALDLSRPVLLLGWSIGGVIAAEMSRIIVERGGEVTFLGLLDSRAPQPEMRSRPVDRGSLAKFYLYQRALSLELAPAPPPASTETPVLLATLRSIGAADGIADEAELERRLDAFMALIRGFFHHEQRSIPVPLHLFETTEQHPSHPRPATLGWDALAPRLEKRSIGGTHFSLLAPRRAAALAATIGSCLPRSGS